jgi:WD40 repeat protein
MPAKLSYNKRFFAIAIGFVAALTTTAQAQQPERQVYFGQDTISAVAFSKDGKKVVFTGKDKMLHVINPQTQQQLLWSQQPIHNDIITAVAFSPDGKQVATGSADKTVKVWDASNNNPNQPNFQPKELFSLKGDKGHTDVIMCVTYSHDGKLIATASLDKTVKIWDAEKGDLIRTIPKADDSSDDKKKGVITIAFSPDDKSIASGGYDKFVRLWNVEKGDEPKWKTDTTKKHLEPIYAITFSHDGKTIASASNDATVQLLDAENGTLTKTLQASDKEPNGHKDSCNAVAFSKDDETIFTCGDGVIKIWDAKNAKVKNTLKPTNTQGGELWSLSVSPDDKWIAAGGEDRIGRIWDMPK